MNIGEAISKRRKELGLTLEDVGDAVGVGKSTVRKWEIGTIVNMRRDKICALAKILNVSPSSFTDDGEVSYEEFVNGQSSSTIQPISTAPINPLYQKILSLDEEDQGRVDGFVSGLLASEKYQKPEQTHTLKIAARGGGKKELTLTDDQLRQLMDMVGITDDNS